MTAFTIGSNEWPGLSKLIEEAGEVLQAAGKLMQRASLGFRDDWNGEDCRTRLAEEMAHLEAAITFVREANGLPLMRDKHEEKLVRYRRWHQEQGAAS